jgi:hypothetical protein
LNSGAKKKIVFDPSLAGQTISFDQNQSIELCADGTEIDASAAAGITVDIQGGSFIISGNQNKVTGLSTNSELWSAVKNSLKLYGDGNEIIDNTFSGIEIGKSQTEGANDNKVRSTGGEVMVKLS